MELPEEAPLKAIQVDGLLGLKDLKKILNTGPNEVALMMDTGVIPFLKWGTIRKVRVFTLNKVLADAEEKGINLLEEARKRRGIKP